MSKLTAELLARCAAPAAAARINELQTALAGKDAEIATLSAALATVEQNNAKLQAESLSGQAAAAAAKAELETKLTAAQSKLAEQEAAAVALTARATAAETTTSVVATALNLKPEQLAGKSADDVRTTITAQVSAATIEQVAALGLAPSSLPAPTPSETATAALTGLESVRAQFAAKLAAGKN